MGHARRMQHNRRRLIWDMIKSKEEENGQSGDDNDQRVHDVRKFEGVPEGKILYHEANVKIYFSNPVGIGEHPDVMGAIEEELEKVAEYREKLQVLQEMQRELW